MSTTPNDSYSPGTRPIWADTDVINRQPHQAGDLSVDVCIVGAGITGLTAADLLKKAGKTVAVIDLARIGYGETSHTTAHLTEVFDIGYRDLISNFGLEGAQLACQSARYAIARIEENVRKYGIDCGFSRVSGFTFTENRAQIDALEDEAEAALRAGVPCETVFEAPLPFMTARAIRFAHQAQFNPIQYIKALAERIPGDGSYIFEETRMLDIAEGEPCRVTTDRGLIFADDVFIAANVPLLSKFFVQTKIASYRTYAIAGRLAASASETMALNNLYWDLDDPYHYVRTYEINGVPHLIIGGEDHKTGQDYHTSVHFERLEEWASQRFDIEAITHRWSGQVVEPVDGLAYIGRYPMKNHVYLATGFSGTGMTFGTIGAMVVSDLILGHHNPWADLYDAGRVKPLASINRFISENIDYPTRLIGDRIAPADVSGPDLLRENEGAILRVGAKKVAAYRDPQGMLHYLSPVCPHMGCYVHWNEAEKSWDCPCHGSRFTPTGTLLNGPAVSDLASESYDENAPMITERYDQTLASDPLGPPILGAFTCPFKARPT